MDEQSVSSICTICGQAEGKPYEFYVAYETITRTRERYKYSQDKIKTKSSYELSEKCKGFVCDLCRKKEKKQSLKIHFVIFIIFAIAFAVSLLLFTKYEQTIWGTIGGFGCCLIPICLIACVVNLLKVIFSNCGSEALCSCYMKEHSEDAKAVEISPGVTKKLVALTPKKAKGEKLID